MSQVTITPDNQGPVLDLVAWVTICVSVLSALTKLLTPMMISRRWMISADSILVVVATIMALGQTGALTSAVMNGLGKKMSSLNLTQLEAFQKADYASEILYILSILLTKMGLVVFFYQISNSSNARLTCLGLSVFILLWGLASIFSIAFECSLPHPWAFLTGNCVARSHLWGFIGSFDVLTDLLVTGLPFLTLRSLQIKWAKRIRLITPFLGRIFVIPLTILRLKFLISALNASDRTLAASKSTILTSMEMNISIIVACIPFFKPFIQGLESGLLTSDLRVLAPTFSANTTNRDGSTINRSGDSSRAPRFGSGIWQELTKSRLSSRVKSSQNTSKRDSDSEQIILDQRAGLETIGEARMPSVDDGMSSRV